MGENKPENTIKRKDDAGLSAQPANLKTTHPEAEDISPEMRGFDDATAWVLETMHGDPNTPPTNYYKPPEGLRECDCAAVVLENECPRCAYNLGFVDGASK